MQSCQVEADVRRSGTGVTLKKNIPAVANSRGAESETDPLPKIPIPEQSAKAICFDNQEVDHRGGEGGNSEVQILKQQCGNQASAEGTVEESSFSETAFFSDWIASWISLR